MRVTLELIFVDDGSKDDSLARLLEFKATRPETRVVKLTRNFGAVHCAKTGLKFCYRRCIRGHCRRFARPARSNTRNGRSLACRIKVHYL